MPKIKLGNLVFYYEVNGSGDPLLLIAGLGSDNSSWLSVLKELSLNFRTIVFDNRGCGRSDILPGAYAISDMADDVVKLLDALGIKQLHVIGHSMGGYIAQELAVRYPRRVGKLVLESTASVSSKRNNILFEDFLKQLRKGDDFEAWIRGWAFWLFSPKSFLRPGLVDTFIKQAVEYPYRQHADGLSGQVAAIASFDARGKVKTIKAKTLVIEGEDDILIVPQEAKALAESIERSDFRLLKDTGHAVHIENPALFTKNVLRFLRT